MSTANTNLVMYGICVSADTCMTNKGIADGNCASGKVALTTVFQST
jgi:hypothetical protein